MSVPSPVTVMLLMPARPYAGGMTCGPFMPSSLKRGSYLPLPQELNTAFVGASKAGDSAMIAPGLRSRLGQPSSRLPMPGENELSTVEWHRAQVVPTCVSVSTPPMVSTVPWRPTTAFSFSNAIVVAGLVKLIVLFWIPCTTAAGNASESTLRPTANAVVGSIDVVIVVCKPSVSVHLVSSPKVSKRKICLPCATRAALAAAALAAELSCIDPLLPQADTSTAAALIVPNAAILRNARGS